MWQSVDDDDVVFDVSFNGKSCQCGKSERIWLANPNIVLTLT